MFDTLLGIHEVAELAEVTPSAVINWRKRHPDFPNAAAELKSGPVFLESHIREWLISRDGNSEKTTNQFYATMAARRCDKPWLMEKVEATVSKLLQQTTSDEHPGILLGRIQSGKTRAFLGVIANCFDNGIDAAIVLTKGTKFLARQTLIRIKNDFRQFINEDKVQVFDIMSLPTLTPYELSQKLIFVVKKEDDNLNRLLAAIESYPALASKDFLIVDDEADLASVSFQKKSGVVQQGKISSQIDALRDAVKNSYFLQVTATPYSLYLQPENETGDGNSIFKPRRPQFTVILPTHSKYVGGDFYFGQSNEPDHPAYYFYREVPDEEREALRKEDRRRIKIENILTEKRAEILVDAILTFITAGVVRRLQCEKTGEAKKKYSFLFHTERSRNSHEWQEQVATAIREALIEEAQANSTLFNNLLFASYTDLKQSVELDNGTMPAYELVKERVTRALQDGYLMITKVNSDNDIEQLLNDDGQLNLRTPLNLFIGGQILDRGITIDNLITFYYGRNPRTFQQDTVLQHSRMYGARTLADLNVTRFYAPRGVYQVMRDIHEFDEALRGAFETGAHDRGVYFLQRDTKNRLRPCSPNKLLFSQLMAVRPGRRLVPIGFQTVSPTKGKKSLDALDELIEEVASEEQPVLVNVEVASELLELAYENLRFENKNLDQREPHLAALEHLSKTSTGVRKGKVWLLIARDRNVARTRAEGRFSNAPDTKQQAEEAKELASDVPVLMLLRQNGEVPKGWRGLPFWWPVILAPQGAMPTIFSLKEPRPD